MFTISLQQLYNRFTTHLQYLHNKITILLPHIYNMFTTSLQHVYNIVTIFVFARLFLICLVVIASKLCWSDKWKWVLQNFGDLCDLHLGDLDDDLYDLRMPHSHAARSSKPFGHKNGESVGFKFSQWRNQSVKQNMVSKQYMDYNFSLCLRLLL